MRTTTLTHSKRDVKRQERHSPPAPPPHTGCLSGYLHTRMHKDALTIRSETGMGKFTRAVVSNLGLPDVLGLQLPEILANRGGGEGFWRL